MKLQGISKEGMKRIAGKIEGQQGTHEGYPNYETWAVALYLDNDQGEYEYWKENAQEAWEEASQDKDRAVEILADTLEYTYAEEVDTSNVPAIFQDLLTQAINAVEWRDVAENILSEIVADYKDRQNEQDMFTPLD